ncbi:MAG: hypothetical protein HGB00_08915 [Chlorobiaceae bacterium]|nr:hypothetical protein [Chlorobiaceae bacterium]
MVVVRVAIPLPFYFVLMSFISFIIGRETGANYPGRATITFTVPQPTASSLQSLWGVAVFDIISDEAFAAVIGPWSKCPRSSS